MASNDSRAADVLCPLYRSGGHLIINCESPVILAVRSQLLFRCKADFNAHFQTYCCTYDYAKCSHYCAVCKCKYND